MSLEESISPSGENYIIPSLALQITEAHISPATWSSLSGLDLLTVAPDSVSYSSWYPIIAPRHTGNLSLQPYSSK